MGRKPFSGKQKKQQLQEKKSRKQGSTALGSDNFERALRVPKPPKDPEQAAAAAARAAADPRRRYALRYNTETREDIEKRKRQSQAPLPRPDKVRNGKSGWEMGERQGTW